MNGGASQWFVFLDEKPLSINDEYFEVRMAQTTPVSIVMNDWPSQVHGGACGFGFADGHAEIHKWKGPSMSSATAVGSATFVKPSADFNDGYWLTSHPPYATPNYQPVIPEEPGRSIAFQHSPASQFSTHNSPDSKSKQNQRQPSTNNISHHPHEKGQGTGWISRGFALGIHAFGSLRRAVRCLSSGVATGTMCGCEKGM